jgi:hypothetical protein
MEPRLVVLHEDRDMVVVNKPGGLLSVPGRTPDLFDSVLSRVREIHPGAQAVHRLDLGTSGVLAVATRRKAEAILRQQFQDRLTRKVYLARVQGVMIEDSGQVDLPLICDWPNRPRQMVCHATGKAAQTDYLVLERADRKARWSSCAPTPGAPTNCACTWPASAIPSWATTSTARLGLANACCSTPASWASTIPTAETGPCSTPRATSRGMSRPLRSTPLNQ